MKIFFLKTKGHRHLSDSDLILTDSNSPVSFYEIRSWNNGELLTTIEFNIPYGHFNFEDSFIIRYKDYYLKINKGDFKITRINASTYPFKSLNNYKVFHNQKNDSYLLKDSQDVIIRQYNVYKSANKYFYENVILEFHFREKENYWIRAIDIQNGQEKWKRKYEGKLGYPQMVDKNVFIYAASESFDPDNPHAHLKRTFKGVDVNSGNEIWSIENLISSNFNRDKSRFYIANQFANEYNSYTGDLVNRVEIIPELKYSVIVTGDDEGYYFKNDGRFGKINRNTGLIDWFFCFYNEHGEKRRISSILLLENGKFILQLSLGKKPGYIMALFDPMENLEHSYILDGKRVKDFNM